MPVELIPNQPIIFQDPIGQYPCLNNDPRQYAVLMQDGDQLCMQWKLLECDATSMCEPNMVMDPVGPNELIGAPAWFTAGGWNSTSVTDLTFDGTSGDGGPTFVGQQAIPVTAGIVHKVTFTVDNYTGTKTYYVAHSDSQDKSFRGNGTYTFYFICYTTGAYNIKFYNEAGTYTSADQIQIKDVSVEQYTTCWLDDLYLTTPSWSYSFDGNNGKFCALQTEGGDLINTNAFVNTGNYHGVSLTIDDCSYGGLQVFLGGVLLGTTSGNGQFNFYGTPTSGTDLTLVKTGDFNGCVSLVSVKDYGDIGSYYVQLFDNNSSNFVNATPVTAYDDRIVLCTTIEDLDWEFGVPGCTNISVELTEGCNSTKYTSVNTINWNPAGHECTKVVEAWNDGYAFGFYFGDVNAPDFKLIHRLRVLAFNPVYQNAAEEYLYSSGNRGRSFAQSQKARTAWFDYCDEFAHDVIRLQLLSQKLFIDNYAFFYPVADYEPEWNDRGKYNLAQSRVTVFHEETVFGSTCGTFANAICPPQAGVISQIQLECIYDGTTVANPMDWTAVDIFRFESDTLGNLIFNASGGSIDFTDPTQLATQLAGIQAWFDGYYGVNSLGNANLVGNTLYFNITASTSVTLPYKTATILLYSPTGTIAFSTTFS